jgi:hypothetical protein
LREIFRYCENIPEQKPEIKINTEFSHINSFETLLMILYYLVPTGTSPKLDIFEIQYTILGVVLRKFP